MGRTAGAVGNLFCDSSARLPPIAVRSIKSSSFFVAAAAADRHMLPTAAAAAIRAVTISKPHPLDCRLLPWAENLTLSSRHWLLLRLAKELLRQR